MLDVDAPLIAATPAPLTVGSIERTVFTFHIDSRDFHFSSAQPMYIVREATRQEFIDAWVAHGASRRSIMLGAADFQYFYEVHTD